MKQNWKRLATVAWFTLAICWWVYVLYIAATEGFDWIPLYIIGILPPFCIAGIWKTGAWIIKRAQGVRKKKAEQIQTRHSGSGR